MDLYTVKKIKSTCKDRGIRRLLQTQESWAD